MCQGRPLVCTKGDDMLDMCVCNGVATLIVGAESACKDPLLRCRCTYEKELFMYSRSCLRIQPHEIPEQLCWHASLLPQQTASLSFLSGCCCRVGRRWFLETSCMCAGRSTRKSSSPAPQLPTTPHAASYICPPSSGFAAHCLLGKSSDADEVPWTSRWKYMIQYDRT